MVISQNIFLAGYTYLYTLINFRHLIHSENQKKQLWLTRETEEKIHKRKKLAHKILATNINEKELEIECKCTNKRSTRTTNKQMAAMKELAHKAEESAERHDVKEL